MGLLTSFFLFPGLLRFFLIPPLRITGGSSPACWLLSLPVRSPLAIPTRSLLALPVGSLLAAPRRAAACPRHPLAAPPARRSRRCGPVHPATSSAPRRPSSAPLARPRIALAARARPARPRRSSGQAAPPAAARPCLPAGRLFEGSTEGERIPNSISFRWLQTSQI
jgi:hypothetical protein